MKKYLLVALIAAFASCKDNNNDKAAGPKPAGTDTAVAPTSNKPAAMNTAAQIMAKKQVPVLCYHRIENGRADEYTVSPEAFAAQMQILKDSGYQTISGDQLHDYLLYNKELPEKPVVITFDDTRLEQFTIGKTEMEKRGFKGLYFIMTISIGKKNYMTKEQIAQLAADGHDVGLHTWDHHMVTKYTPEDWVKQIAEPQKLVAGITGKPCDYFAYPFGINDHTSGQELKKYFKLSFILSTKRDSTEPAQFVRRMIVPSGWSPQGMMKVMHSTFSRD